VPLIEYGCGCGTLVCELRALRAIDDAPDCANCGKPMLRRISKPARPKGGTKIAHRLADY